MAKILIVDDETSLAEVLGLFLSDCGHLVRTAPTAKRALRLGRMFRPDVLIADFCLLDDQDGGQVARALRAEDPSLHVILITGLLVDEVHDSVADIPNLRLLGKPLDLDDVQRHVLELIAPTSPVPRQRSARRSTPRVRSA